MKNTTSSIVVDDFTSIDVLRKDILSLDLKDNKYPHFIDRILSISTHDLIYSKETHYAKGIKSLLNQLSREHYRLVHANEMKACPTGTQDIPRDFLVAIKDRQAEMLALLGNIVEIAYA